MKLTQEYVQSVFHYDQTTGNFTWRQRKDMRKCWNSRFAGKATGTIGRAGKNNLSYVLLRIDDRLYKAHRIAWLYVYGENPLTIDHIDGNGINNRISNLRAATRSQNQCNRGIQTNNSSGYKGVSFSKIHNKWAAYIKKDRKKKHIGLYESAEMAHQARLVAQKQLHGEFARAA